MPGIGLFDNAVTGYLGFCAVKFGGYSLAARVISKSYHPADRNAFVVGGVRTLIGMAVGGILFGLDRVIGGMDVGGGPILYIAGLIPIRLFEWWLLVWLFYDRKFEFKGRGWVIVLCGTLWSFLLDVPAAIGWLMTGGRIVC